ncbi:MAG TPA: DUF4177 domain-containing protein [Fimbriimonas sp.]|nr:DUF4177 domain-containing protein [Fimbriimonas sp.]
MAVSWEYRVLHLEGSPADMQATLNRVGADGWEFVNVEVDETTGTVFSGQAYLCFMKRPLA